jgi:hypothetical protein
MAETLDPATFEFPTARGAAKYPWKEWTDGQIWRVVEGTDFESVGGLRVSLYKKAAKLKLDVRTRLTVVPNPDGGKPLQVMTFQFKAAK